MRVLGGAAYCCERSSSDDALSCGITVLGLDIIIIMSEFFAENEVTRMSDPDMIHVNALFHCFPPVHAQLSAAEQSIHDHH
jgi:hypothetical protein